MGGYSLVARLAVLDQVVCRTPVPSGQISVTWSAVDRLHQGSGVSKLLGITTGPNSSSSQPCGNKAECQASLEAPLRRGCEVSLGRALA